MNMISVKGFVVITLIAIVGILVTKFLINKFGFIPAGLKSAVNAV